MCSGTYQSAHSSTIAFVARPDRHRPQLVAAATALLRRQGYAATSVGDVLAASGATNGSLYHHFPGGKEDLARAAVDTVGGQIEAGLRHVLAEADGDLLGALRTWIDGLVAALEDDPRNGCPVAPTAIEAAGISESLRESAAGAFGRWTAALEEALAAAGRPDADAAARARVLLAAIEGALLLDRTAQTTEHLRALRAALPALLA